jgi:hypothetical protein
MAMLLSRSRLIGMGLAVVTVAGVGALAYAAISGARTLPRLAAERDHVVGAVEAAGEPGQDRLAQARERKDAPAAKDTLPAPRDRPAAGNALPARTTTSPAASSAAREAADRDPPHRTDRDLHVSAPDTDVDVDGERGKVRVRAPYTKVDVDPDQGRVRVRAPYVNLDIRW